MIIWYYLSFIAFAWLVFGTIQDIRKREIANWLTLSLLGIGLFSRLIYSIEIGEWSLLLNGLFSSVLFVAFGYGLYYSKVFAGGDAKLLMGLGAFIPGNLIIETFLNGLTAILFLLLIGAIYSLFFSFWISIKNRDKFYQEILKFRKQYYIIIPLAILLCATALVIQDIIFRILCFMFAGSILAYPYFKAIDRCMIKIYKPSMLTPGDWLQQNVRVGNKVIRATVHGLSERDIVLLRKYRKNVLIKEGIPFVPVFLITYITMVFFYFFELRLMDLLV